MTRLIHLLLIVFAFAGMAAQPAALAAVPVDAQASMDMAGGCDEMGNAFSENGAPCKQMIADCAAMMGCALPSFIIPDRGSSATLDIQTMSATWPLVRPLTNRTMVPELHPPHA